MASLKDSRASGIDIRGLDVLVTGASGLIGSHLVAALLARGSRVHVLLIPEPEQDSLLARSGNIDRVVVHRGRLEDASSVERAVALARPLIVFHLGAQTLVGVARENPVRTFDTNIGGTWRLLEACRELDEPPLAVAVASSDKAYGASDSLPYRESDALSGTEPYEASKAATDILARTYAAAYGLPVRVARCGNVYGPGDLNWSRLVPGTIRSLLRAERPVVRSDGTPVRDYIHVDDVVTAYLALALMPVAAGEAFNFSSGERRSVSEVIGLIAGATDSPLEPIIENTSRGELAAQWLDSSKAATLLGWRATRAMAESLPSVVDWYRELLR